jgi:cytochrome c553
MGVRDAIGLVAGALAALSGVTAFVRADGNRALGEYLSSECVACHQLAGRSEGIPSIVGWPGTTFVEIMGEYRAKKRNNAIMQTIAARLSDEEIAALAVYFGSLKPVD